MVQKDEYFMQLAYDQALKAEREGEVPVGAVVVHGEKLIACGHNLTVFNHDASAHAEIMALRSAGHARSNHRLAGCELFVTLEPCVMCLGAIVQARLKRVVFGATDPKSGSLGGALDLRDSHAFNHEIQVNSGILAAQCGNLLEKFFLSRRKKKHKQKL